MGTTAKDFLYRLGTGLHRTAFSLSKGRLFGRAMGMQVVELITTGRRSGSERSTMLTVPIVEHDRLVLVASFGGDDRHPAWYLNLRANPKVRAVMGGATRHLVARTATSEERSRLWPRIVATYKGYDAYQSRTSRQIPVVILEPAGHDGEAGS